MSNRIPQHVTSHNSASARPKLRAGENQTKWGQWQVKNRDLQFIEHGRVPGRLWILTLAQRVYRAKWRQCSAAGREKGEGRNPGIFQSPQRLQAVLEDVFSLATVTVGDDIALPWRMGDTFLPPLNLKLICIIALICLSSVSYMLSSYRNFGLSMRSRQETVISHHSKSDPRFQELPAYWDVSWVSEFPTLKIFLPSGYSSLCLEFSNEIHLTQAAKNLA